jgi:fatty-acyl-CoA synthase
MLNFGDMLDVVEANLPPETPAFLHGTRCVTWGEAARLSNNLARALLDRGLEAGDKVALYMRNGPEYLLTLAAAFKARLTAVNVNYRYTDRELVYLLNDSDARTVVHGQEFRPQVATIRGDLPQVRHWIEIAGDDASPPDFAERFDALAEAGDGAPLGIERSGGDLLFIYTGGTTGMPKGVMWEHGELRELLVRAARELGPVPDTLEELAAAVRALGPGPRMLPASPLMHGTGLIPSISVLMAGGSIVTLTGRSFDAGEMLDAIEAHRPDHLVIVGDSFGRPLLAELDGGGRRRELGSVAAITSSGVMWSAEIKQGLLRHMPGAMLNDVLSSSEALGLGAAVTTQGEEATTGRFTIGDRCRVFDEDDRPVEPGSDRPGLLALGPPNPLGYYGDPEKSAATFRVIGGVRYCVPGDWVRVEADGTLTFLGRGSGCINTGGEKVFAEEVEETLKLHASVADALVVGVPDPKWGQAIVAVVAPAGHGEPDEAALRDHVRAHLAAYKVPKRVLAADRPLRAPNGKADYAAARARAESLPLS